MKKDWEDQTRMQNLRMRGGNSGSVNSDCCRWQVRPWRSVMAMPPLLFSLFPFDSFSVTPALVHCSDLKWVQTQTHFLPRQSPSISSWPMLQTQRPRGTSQSPSAPQYNLGVSLSSAFSTHVPLTSTREDESRCGTVSGNAARFLKVDGQRL